MQTTNLPLQLNNLTGASSAGVAPRANAANAASDASQFSAMLSSEMAQAQAKTSAPAPAPSPQPSAAPQQDAPKPTQANAPAQNDDTPAPQQAQSTQDSTKTGASDGARQADADKSDDKSEDSANASTQQPTDPASAMLALMASLQHPAAKTAPTPKGMAQSFDALAGGAKGKLGDGKQLAALQAAMKSVSKDGAGAAGDAKALAAAATAKNPFDAGAALGVNDKAGAAGANAAADLSAALAGAATNGGHKASFDAADLSLQQARDAAQQATQIQAPIAGALQATQPAAFDAAQAVGAADELSAQVGTDAWEDQVGQKVVYMIGNEEQVASLTLNPPDLGPMQVVLSVTNDQASVTFSSNQEEVRQALEDALPRLREMMSENGISLGNASVNAGMPDQRQAQQEQSSGRGGGNYGRANGVNGVGSASDTPEPRVTRTAILGDRGMVDTFA